MKKTIKPFDYANQILTQLKKGVLVTTKHGDSINTMTISWGALGIEWAKPIFTIYIRENRHTKTLLDAQGEFTVNIPMGEFNKKILSIAGTKSGKSVNKIEELNLTLVDPVSISVPGIKELPLTLECKVIYKQEQDKHAISPEMAATYYPQDVDGDFHGANKDYHTAYYGEIVNAYIIE